MLNGFYAFKGDGSPVYSPEFRRGGLLAVFSLYIGQVLNSPTLTVTIEGRTEEGTSWATLGTFPSITTAGSKMSSQSAVPQVLRFKFEVTGASEMSGAFIQLLSATWRD